MVNINTKNKIMEMKIKARFSKGVIEPLEKLEMEEGKEVTVIISEMFSKVKRIESLKRSFGGWKGLINADELKRNIYKDRTIATRLIPKL